MDEVAQKKYRIFLKWYAMPETARKPRTMDEFCETMGLSKTDIANYEHLPTYTEDLFRASMEWGKSKVPELLKSLYAQYIETKSPSVLKMYKELLMLDKTDKKLSDEEESFGGVLRELFKQSR